MRSLKNLVLGSVLALFISAPAWGSSITVTATAQVDTLSNGTWPGQALSDYVAIGDTISATFVLDANAYNSYLTNEFFNPTDYTAEYRAHCHPSSSRLPLPSRPRLPSPLLQALTTRGH